MIEAFRLGICSRGATLWDGVDLAFESGSVGVVTGPASSGKTLLLSVLRGERQPDAGDVVVSGESLFRGDAAAARSFRASCGHIPDRFADPGGQTVGDLFRLSALAGGGMREAERRERRDRLLAMVGLEGAEEWTLRSLSTSERVRAALAAELLRGPRFLFADCVVETAGSPFRELLGGLFRALAREGNTVVLAERRLPERWEAMAGAARAAGPFRVYRLPVHPAGGAAETFDLPPAAGNVAGKGGGG